jgi:two-component sensor histidine kinase
MAASATPQPAIERGLPAGLLDVANAASGASRREAQPLFGPQARGLARDLGLALALVALATLVRWSLGYITPGILPFTTYFPAILVAALVGGWRLGTAVSVMAIAAGWYLFMGRPGSFALPDAASVMNLLLSVVAIGAVIAGGGYAHSLMERLRRSRDATVQQNLHYDTLFETMSEGFAICEAIRDESGAMTDYTILEVNPALQGMVGVGSEVVGSRLSDWPGERTGWLKLCDNVLKTGKPQEFEYQNPQSGLWHEIHVIRITDSRLAHFFFDITARKNADARQAELFDELNHRVKNNLGLVASLLQLQARGADPAVRDQLTKAVARVHSVAQVHSTLYLSARQDEVDFGAYLTDLCASLSQSLINEDRAELRVEAESVMLAVDTAIPLGMVLTELVTNAVKYAYPAPGKGLILVRFKRQEDRLVLSVSDSGIGLPSPRSRRAGGLGMKLVKSLVSQIKGELVVRSRPGATFEIKLPPAPKAN